jgi:hypothetical protein
MYKHMSFFQKGNKLWKYRMTLTHSFMHKIILEIQTFFEKYSPTWSAYIC